MSLCDLTLQIACDYACMLICLWHVPLSRCTLHMGIVEAHLEARADSLHHVGSELSVQMLGQGLGPVSPCERGDYPATAWGQLWLTLRAASVYFLWASHVLYMDFTVPSGPPPTGVEMCVYMHVEGGGTDASLTCQPALAHAPMHLSNYFSFLYYFILFPFRLFSSFCISIVIIIFIARNTPSPS